jgi:GH15 family glucan-1,4-alpha-glucosidase
MAARIEDYAMIGDCKTAALVSREGAIDWLCLPRFDSMACFAGLLGTSEQGSWRIAPSVAKHSSKRSYVDGSLILTTRFETEHGAFELMDFMPIGLDSSHIVRMVTGIRGCVAVESRLVARFDYGKTKPWTNHIDSRTIAMIAGPDTLVLHTDQACNVEDDQVISSFDIKQGETVAFVLSHGLSHLPPPSTVEPMRLLQRTKAYWKGWSARCESAGPWTDIVKRSLITLKGLTYDPTGGIVAAVTTSLPERIGGERNWDYRYCWLRDATFTLLALLTAGYDEEADAWRGWLMRAIAGEPSQVQIMYGVAGEKRLEEWTLPWLPGYENSAPVRVGNDAAHQVQLDIYGEVTNVMTIAMQAGLPPVARGLQLREQILEHLEETWRDPDEGLWEIRGEPRHFTHSKVMAWVAFDRAARYETEHGQASRHEHYRRIADEIHRDICKHACDPKRNCFVQSYGSTYLDASLLLLPMVDFVSADDERMRNTVSEIEQRLMSDGLVLRYETDTGIDGLPAGEGAFLACSFWLVENQILQGRLDEAEALFSRLVALSNDVGLLAEEYDPKAKRQLGNFPQAFSHVALTNAAFSLARARADEKKAAADKAV